VIQVSGGRKDSSYGSRELLGEDCGATRPPSAWPLTDAQIDRLRKQLAAWGLGRPAA
jgi:4-hydroxy-tetrahydrodipicolinate synthase